MFLLSKKKCCLIFVLVLIVVLTGCSSDEDVSKNQKLVLQSVEVRDENNLEATFSNGQVKTIRDFALQPLEEGRHKVEFTYNGVKYQQQVDYNPSKWQWEKVAVTEVEGLSVLEVISESETVYLDKLLVTDDLDYVPSKDDKGLNANSFDNHFYFEAEEASRQEDFTLEIEKSNQASQKKYVVVAEKGDKNQLKYKFNLSAEVAVWLRVSKANTLSVSLSKENLPQAKEFETGNQKYKLGLSLMKEEEYNELPKLKTLSNVTAPSQVDLSNDMPPVGNQGSQGSCVGWATAYAYKTYQEKQDHNWNVNSRDNQFSPAYVYNQINGGQDRGSHVNDALNLIKNQGVCPLSVMPYDDNDYWTQPNSRQRQVASKYKAKSWGTLAAGNVSAMKNHLAAGDVITVAIPVYQDFNVSNSNPIYDNTYGNLSGWHAITFVGYSDSKRAFKLINSWGSRWGFNGYGWMSYDLVNRLDIRGYIMTDQQTNDNNDNDDNDDNEPEPNPEPSNNLALNKSLRVSGYYSNYYPANIVDGDNSSFWAVRSYNNAWVYVNLGSRRDISNMKIKWSKRNYPQQYYVQRWNGRSWETVKTIRSNGDWDEFNSSFSAQYVRIYCTNNNSYYYTMYEWKIFGN
ncbi:C1 family peptidase [Halanaerobacter jeridensis]|uniref:C1A family cysteine protease n=1 Tax=Halanaerobacter jeridensis TaxID=706427 RepID=A0A938XU88_9FIRM|nr:C1 family peptidase [Halanaerobacter jeridensis]MBM7556421.1 C1A family cysteine protease [Halanaerobacter jeridensis]